jgi:hypothetical protein
MIDETEINRRKSNSDSVPDGDLIRLRLAASQACDYFENETHHPAGRR